MFHAENPYRRQAYRPFIGQGTSTPPAGSPLPVQTPAPTPPVQAPPAPLPAVAAAPSMLGQNLMLVGSILLGGATTWVGIRAGMRDKGFPRAAAYSIAALGGVKAVWDLGTLIGWPPSSFPV